ncbi:uncharacterized protein LOC111629917 isoform X2 [Centruroides sculpturatus]|uniref:uncharacterized protein LOC111629917 isoform X2 n=1 Tax=Centruroides sculpturatus TaxID=218467 RepID=UPI000C6D81FC|nr:uncharacterized protein LOC111629917 isoform X2 [Centruroides sculpturatus]
MYKGEVSKLLLCLSVLATITIVKGNVVSRDLTSENFDVYSPAATLNLAITSPPFLAFDCGKRPDGSYPDYRSGCKYFYVCKNGRVSRFWCNDGEIYDPALSYCVSDRVGKCSNSTERKEKSRTRCRFHGVYPDYENGCRSFFFCKGVETRLNCPPETKFDWRRGVCVDGRRVSCATLNCQGKTDGTYEDAEGGCRRYYTCEGGIKSEFLCPPGQIYDRRFSSCSSIVEGARCADLSFHCAGLPDGYYPDYGDECRTFYLCIGGRSKSFHCPPGLAFDREMLSCDFSYRVVCRRTDICREREDGIAPDFDRDCREFAVCENGTAVRSGVCPQGKVLDPGALVCRPRSMSSCRPVGDAQCRNKGDGVYGDVDSGCGAYYLCLRGRVSVTSFCPEGTAFHRSVGKCLSSSLVACGDSRPSVSLPNACEGRVGLFPDFQSECRNYHVCAFGMADTLACGAGLVFDNRSGKCVPVGSADCTPPTVLATFECPLEEEDRYPESGDGCALYHECWRGKGATYRCPSGHIDRSTKRRCHVSDRVCPGDLPKRRSATVSRVIQWQFECGGRENGVFVSDQCGVFHVCAEGKVFSYVCPPGRIFDVGSSRCRPGTCGRSDSAPWFAEAGSFDCQGRKDGMYPDPSTYCRRYFVCEGGKASAAYCREGEVFDERIVTCVDASDANCSAVDSANRIEPSEKIAVRAQKPETPSSSFRCPAGATGFFPDYQSGCRKFHICFRRLRKSYTCPSVLLFNPATKSCDLPENVRCGPGERVPDVPDCGGRTGDCRGYTACAGDGPAASDCPPGGCRKRVPCRKETARAGNVHAHGMPDRYAFTCADKPDGFYPDYARDCHVFYRCVRGKKFSHYCKQGLLFDPATGICQFEQTVDCSPPPSVEVT